VLEKPLSSQLLAHLIQTSTPYRDPLGRVPWDALDLESYWLPVEALSLDGTPEFAALPPERRLALSHYEYIHLLLAGLWSEGLFMARLVRALRWQNSARLTYSLHQLREEAGHSLMFLEFLDRCGLPIPENPFFDQPLLTYGARRLRFGSLGFWVAAMFGEELPDRLNRLLRRHRARVNPVALSLSTLHIIDEARHAAHARDRVACRLEHTSRLKRLALLPVLSWGVRRYVDTLYYPPPSTYALAGLTPGRRWAALARANPARRQLVHAHLRPSLMFLREKGFGLSL